MPQRVKTPFSLGDGRLIASPNDAIQLELARQALQRDLADRQAALQRQQIEQSGALQGQQLQLAHERLRQEQEQFQANQGFKQEELARLIQKDLFGRQLDERRLTQDQSQFDSRQAFLGQEGALGRALQEKLAANAAEAQTERFRQQQEVRERGVAAEEGRLDLARQASEDRRVAGINEIMERQRAEQARIQGLLDLANQGAGEQFPGGAADPKIRELARRAATDPTAQQTLSRVMGQLALREPEVQADKAALLSRGTELASKGFASRDPDLILQAAQMLAEGGDRVGAQNLQRQAAALAEALRRERVESVTSTQAVSGDLAKALPDAAGDLLSEREQVLGAIRSALLKGTTEEEVRSIGATALGEVARSAQDAKKSPVLVDRLIGLVRDSRRGGAPGFLAPQALAEAGTEPERLRFLDEEIRRLVEEVVLKAQDRDRRIAGR